MEHSAELELRLFGELSLTRAGVPVRGRATQKRRLALLAILAMAGERFVSRDRIVGLLWPDAEPEQARKLLSESLYVIRRELGETLIETAGDELRLTEGMLRSDVRAFDDAIERGDHSSADSLYRAPFCEGWYAGDLREFERWVDDERRRLALRHASVLESLVARAESESRWREAVTYWRRLTESDPYRATYAIGHARALASLGERPAALRSLVLYQDKVRADLQVEPDHEIISLIERFRREGKPKHRPSTPPEPTPSIGELATEELATSSPASVIAPRRTSRWLAVGLAVMVLAATGLVLARPSRTPPADLNRLAVLYFRDGSPQRDLGPTADVITEALIEQLAGVNSFEVVQRGGVRRFQKDPLDPDSVGRVLHAGSVVDGTVRRVDERLAVSVRLLDARSGSVVWSAHFDDGSKDLAQLQQRIGQDVASAIRQRLGVQVRVRELNAGTSNERARQLVARANRERDDARELGASAPRGEDLAAARTRLSIADSLYAQAHVEDPRWTRPVVERGWTALAQLPLSSGASRVATLQRAVSLGEEAIALSQKDARAHELRGTARWRLYRERGGALTDSSAEIASAIADLNEAVAEDSTLSRAWASLSNIYWIRRDARLAYVTGARALRLDAYLEDAPRIMRNLVSASLLGAVGTAGQRAAVDSAKAWCSRGRAAYPRDWQFAECELSIMKYDEVDRPDPNRAWQLVARVDSLDPPATAVMAGHAYSPIYRRMVAAAVSARAGDLARARSVLAEQKRDAARLDGNGPPNVQLDLIPDEITLREIFGEREAAVALLDSVLCARPILEGIVPGDPILSRTAARRSRGPSLRTGTPAPTAAASCRRG